MKRIFASGFIGILMMISLQAVGQACMWISQSNGNFSSWPLSNTTDAAGNTYAAGSFDAPAITFGGITLTNSTGSGTDVFLVKYDPSGSVLWAHSFGSTQQDFAHSVTTDRFGNVYLYGTFYSAAITFGAYTLTNTSTCENFLVKLNSVGTVIWARKEVESATSPGTNQAVSVATDSIGNVLVSGYYDSSITIGSTYLTAVPGGGNIYVAKYDSAGAVRWVKSSGDTSFSYSTAMAVDGSGNIYVSGSYGGRIISFGGITLTNTLGGDLFLVKYDSSGNAIWARTIGDNCSSIIHGIATDPAGNADIAGYFVCPTITFGTITLTNMSTTSGDNAFAVQYSSTGAVNWAHGAGGTQSDGAYAIATDVSGNMYIGGYFTSPLITLGTFVFSHPGVLLAEVDMSGTIVWVKESPYRNGGGIFAISVDGSGYPHATGNFDSTLMLDAYTVTDTSTLLHSEIFTTKFNYLPEYTAPLAEEPGVALSPNPASDRLTIIGAELNHVAVYNIVGQELIDENHHGEAEATIDTRILAPGMYILRINDAVVKRFIKE